MEQHGEERQILPMPDLTQTDALREWMQQYVNILPKGYDAQTHSDGTPLTPEEQKDNYIKQTLDVIDSCQSNGSLEKAKDRITRAIMGAVRPNPPFT